MSPDEGASLFGAETRDIRATMVFTEALLAGTLSWSAYAQLRYNVIGRADVFQSLLLPLIRVITRRISGPPRRRLAPRAYRLFR